MARSKTREQTQFERRKQLIKLGAIVFALLVVVALVAWIIESPKTAKITVLVAPTDATVTIGGKRFRNGTHRIEPGTYDVEITRVDFGSYSGQITATAGQTERLYVCLEKNEDNDAYYDADANQKDYEACYTVQEYQAEQLEKETYSDPVFAVAPYHNYQKGFYIDPYIADDESVHIRITLITCLAERAEGLKQNALEWLGGKGIDTSKYPLEYKSCAYGDK